ncbi:MAG: hypothetical protein ACLGQU_09275 [Acidobacteriota bacterium]
MENDASSSEASQQASPSPISRDPLIRYSVFAALGCAGVCVLFAIVYIFAYSLNATISFEHHFDAYLSTTRTGNLSTVLGLHMAQNRMFLQSCGIIAGIFFACVGMALFLVGIQGSMDDRGRFRDDGAGVQRLAPGAAILLVSMSFVGVAAMHPIELVPARIGNSPTNGQPSASSASSASPPPLADPATAAPQPTPARAQALLVRPAQPADPAATSRVQTATRPPAANPAPSSSSGTAGSAPRSDPPTPAMRAWPATATAQPPTSHPAVAATNQSSAPPSPQHHFVP